MNSILLLLFVLLFFSAFLGLSAWFIISLIQFIVAAAKRRPNWGKKLASFIAASVCQGFLWVLLIVFVVAVNFLNMRIIF